MEAANKYRYTITDRFGAIIVHPLGENDFSIEWTPDDDDAKKTYKIDFGGNIVFVGAAFTRLLSSETSIYRCVYQEVTIEKPCVVDGETEWNVIFSGIISLIDGDWDLDRCRVSIKFREKYPESCMDVNKGENIDLFSKIFADNRVTVKMYQDNYTVQEKVCERVFVVGVDDPFAPYWCEAGTPEAGYWQAYSIVFDLSTGERIHRTRWVRDYMVLTCPAPIPLENWHPLTSHCGTGTRAYARWSSLYDCQPYKSEGVYKDCRVLGLGGQVIFDNGLPLKNILEAFVAEYCPTLTVKSDFFQINPEVATTTNYITGERSKVDRLVFFQKSDVKRPSATANATKADWTWDKLMMALRYIFNIRWRVEEDKLVIEHVHFFQKDEGLDLTLDKYKRYVLKKNRYTYKKDSLPKKEVWLWKEQSDEGDFPGLPVTYEYACVNDGAKGNTVTYPVDDVMTDLLYALENFEAGNSNVSDIGFVLMATYEVGSDKYVITEMPILEDIRRPNNSLAWAQLQRDYHRYQRPLKVGKMNGVNTTFLTVIPTKQYAPISIPFCCGDEFNPDNIVKTPFGNGTVDKATFKFIGSTLELNLLYSAEDEIDTSDNTPPVAVNDVVDAAQDAPKDINVIGNDIDSPGAILVPTVVLPPLHGTTYITLSNTIVYTPDPGYIGADSFTYLITDEWGATSNIALVSITVKYGNDRISGAFNKECEEPLVGTSVPYTVEANLFLSDISKEDANTEAEEFFDIQGQAHANLNGDCVEALIGNDERTGYFTKNNCPDGLYGNTLLYTFEADQVFGSTKEAANASRDALFNSYGQTFANTSELGTCSTAVEIVFEVVTYPDFINARYETTDPRAFSWRFLEAGLVLGGKLVTVDVMPDGIVHTYSVSLLPGSSITRIESNMMANGITSAATKYTRIYHNGVLMGNTPKSFPAYITNQQIFFYGDTALSMPDLVNGDVVRLEHGTAPVEPEGITFEVENTEGSKTEVSRIRQFDSIDADISFDPELQPGDDFISDPINDFEATGQIRVSYNVIDDDTDGKVIMKLYKNDILIGEEFIYTNLYDTAPSGEMRFYDVDLVDGDELKVVVSFEAAPTLKLYFDADNITGSNVELDTMYGKYDNGTSFVFAPLLPGDEYTAPDWSNGFTSPIVMVAEASKDVDFVGNFICKLYKNDILMETITYFVGTGLSFMRFTFEHIEVEDLDRIKVEISYTAP